MMPRQKSPAAAAEEEEEEYKMHAAATRIGSDEIKRPGRIGGHRYYIFWIDRSAGRASMEARLSKSSSTLLASEQHTMMHMHAFTS